MMSDQDDEPEPVPSQHTLDALSYMMASLDKPQPAKCWHPILTSEQANFLSGLFPELEIGESSMIGMDFGAANVVAVMVTWAPDGARYTPITFQESHDPEEDREGQQ